MSRHFVFTSESVTRGHPDKLCDIISDAVVGSYLRQDPLSRVSVESAVSTGIVFVSAKLQTGGSVDVPRVVRDVVADAGYRGEDFNPRDCTVMTSISEVHGPPRPTRLESEMDPEELSSVVAGTPITVFGYACDQTSAMLPLPIALAHRLARRLEEVGREDAPWLSPDGTVQVSVEFEGRRPVRIHGVSVLAAARKGEESPRTRQAEWIRERVVAPSFAESSTPLDARTRVDVNPDGAPIHGGPARHAGLTGRKTHVDTYGEYSRNSASALSGKDPSRIDRVGAYAARHAAKCLLAAGLAREAEVMLTYAPGLARPVSVQVQTFGTGTVEDDELTDRVSGVLDFRPAAIVRRFGLRELALDHADGFYRRLSAYGQMGRVDLEAPWERTDESDLLTH